MAGMTDLSKLLASMEPELLPSEVVFCTIPWDRAIPASIEPIGSFLEKEGRTLILEADEAAVLDCPKSAPMRQITLRVHSSLQAVGLTAAISTELMRHGISANVVAAYYHDHIFVPSQDAERAVEALRAVSRRSATAH